MRKFLACQIDIYAIIISDCQDAETRSFFSEFCKGDDSRIHYVPKSGEALSALLCVVPLQRLAFDTTIALGYNPDRPRNLAKELTTQWKKDRVAENTLILRQKYWITCKMNIRYFNKLKIIKYLCN